MDVKVELKMQKKMGGGWVGGAGVGSGGGGWLGGSGWIVNEELKFL